MSSPAIAIDGADFEHAPGRGVTGVTLTLDAGQCLAVLGPNGSGKTTLTHLVLGLLRPARGRVAVLGAEVGAGSRAHLRDTAACLDTPALWESLSGWDNAYFTTRAHGLDSAQTKVALTDLFERAGLADQAHDPVCQYSYGMRRKLGLVQALAPNPALLVLDEPSAGVDAAFLLELATLVRERRNRGRTTWLSGNDPDWIEGVADRAVFLASGQIVAADTVSALLAQLAPLRELELTLDTAQPLRRPEIEGLEAFLQEGDTVRALVGSDPHLVPRILGAVVGQGVSVRSLEVRRGTLRDAFLRVAGREFD